MMPGSDQDLKEHLSTAVKMKAAAGYDLFFCFCPMADITVGSNNIGLFTGRQKANQSP